MQMLKYVLKDKARTKLVFAMNPANWSVLHWLLQETISNEQNLCSNFYTAALRLSYIYIHTVRLSYTYTLFR
ncbi:hypothetical protein MKW98_007809 [Papaver atlanticum]|uniref:Uncharacterized protein n=1 Tax=Papaver atlanticum TaxID=357466 RepID=A0AAD4RY67_9MAGN|nr:hypothetical protein MKW98_007809 [Papaver atlanticum]